MAHPRPQNSVHLCAEGVQHIQGDKRLDGSGEAAAVDPAGPPAAQQPLGEAKSQRYFLALLVPGGDDVLQIPPAG